MQHVLVLNSEKRAPFEVLDRLPDITYLPVTNNALAPLYPSGPLLCVQDLGDIASVFPVIQDYFGQSSQRVHTIIAATEKAVPTAAFLRSFYALPGMAYDQALLFSNKFLMKQAISQFLPVTPFSLVQKVEDVLLSAEETGWPIVVKPIMGAGAEHTHFIHSQSHYRALYTSGVFDGLVNKRLPIVVERFVEIQAEYHCDAVVRNGDTIFFSASRYFAPPLTSVGSFHGGLHLSPSDTATPALETLHRCVVETLKLQDGVIHLEVFETDQGLVFGEVACRPGGGGISTSLKHVYGVDLWEEHIRASLQLPSTIAASLQHIEDGKVNGYCGLPAKGGTISYLTSQDDLLKLDEIYDVEMRHKVGDHLEGRSSSVFFTGEVFFQLSQKQSTRHFLDKLKDIYQCSMADTELTVR